MPTKMRRLKEKWRDEYLAKGHGKVNFTNYGRGGYYLCPYCSRATEVNIAKTATGDIVDIFGMAHKDICGAITWANTQIVIESKSEAGYWSNQLGWAKLENATVFRNLRFNPPNAPDTRFVTKAYAETHRVDDET